MAGLVVVSAVAAVISATQSAIELTGKAPPIFSSCSDARNYLNQALTFRDETLKLMESYQNVLPHEIVHKWRLNHNLQLEAWTNIQTDLDAFNSLGIMKKAFSLRLRQKITSSAFKHAKECMESWTSTKMTTDTLRSQIVSRAARENGVLAIDLLFISEGSNTPTHDPTNPTQTSAAESTHATPHESHDGSNPFTSPEEYDMTDMQCTISSLPRAGQYI